MSNTTQERLALVKACEQKFGFTIKKSASSTGGLSVSNEDRRANGFAHLLCNTKNFQTVLWLLKDSAVIDIPEEFAEGYDFTSFLYACGTAPRIVRKGSKHVSKDAVKLGVSQKFVQWAQATRIAGVGGMAGLSRSVKEALQDKHRYGTVDEYGNIVPTNDEEAAKMAAAEEQLDMKRLQEAGGVAEFLIAGTVQGFANTLAGKIAAAMAAAKAATAPAPTPVKVEVAKPAPIKKTKQKTATPFVMYLPEPKMAKPKAMKIVKAVFNTAEVWEGDEIPAKPAKGSKRSEPKVPVVRPARQANTAKKARG